LRFLYQNPNLTLLGSYLKAEPYHKQVYDDQIKIKTEHEAMGRENQGEKQRERRH
jgi:hypothetical protein